MRAVILALGLLLMILGVGGVFMAVAVMGPHDAARIAAPPAREPSDASGLSRHPFVEELGAWRLRGMLELSPEGRYELSLQVLDAAGRPSTTALPGLSVDMVGHAMGEDSPPFALDERGLYRAAGTLSMQGRWRFRISLGANSADVTVDFAR